MIYTILEVQLIATFVIVSAAFVSLVLNGNGN